MKLPFSRDFARAFKTSWPLTSIFLVTVVVLAVAVVTWHYYGGEEKTAQESKTETAKTQPPKEDFFSVNAKILAIDPQKKEITASFVGNVSWSKQWKLLITDKTTLATFESYSKASSLKFEARKTTKDPNELNKIFEQNLKRLSLTDLKAGDIIYMMSSDDDFAKVSEAKNVQAILLQEI